MTERGVSLAEAVRRLRQILGKFQQDVGIIVWGSTIKKGQGDYRVIRVNDDGELAVELT